MEDIARTAGVESMQLVDSAAPGAPSVSLAAPDGSAVAVLMWDVRLPSLGILAKLWPLGATIAGGMLVLGGLICRYLVRHTRDYHDERMRQEHKLSTAMLEARESSHAKSLFLANMSHELRTPLNAVIGYSQLLRLSYVGGLNEKQREYVDSIEGAGRHLLSMLQDILDLSKIEAGREELDEEDVALDEIAAKAIALVAPRAREKGVKIVVEGTAPMRLRADGRRLLQMLLNLLSNAVRFSPKNGALSLTWRVRAGGEVEIAIHDRGPGILEADMQRVLQPFHRRPEHAAHAGGDSNGLGLPLTARLMSLHGGRLELANAPDGGLIATLVFPARRTLAAVAAPAASAPAPARLRVG
jgi:signal transduction histidine kinase